MGSSGECDDSDLWLDEYYTGGEGARVFGLIYRWVDCEVGGCLDG